VKNCFLPSISMALSFAVFAVGQAKKTVSWSGVIVYSSCNADEAFAESPECFTYAPGANLALYDDTNRVMYNLAPQEPAAGHLRDTVTVSTKTPFTSPPSNPCPSDLPSVRKLPTFQPTTSSGGYKLSSR